MGPSDKRVLSTLHGSRNVPLCRRRWLQHFRQADTTDALGRARDSSGPYRRITHRQRKTNPHSSALPLPAGRKIQRNRQYRRRRTTLRVSLREAEWRFEFDDLHRLGLALERRGGYIGDEPPTQPQTLKLTTQYPTQTNFTAMAEPQTSVYLERHGSDRHDHYQSPGTAKRDQCGNVARAEAAGRGDRQGR